MHEMELEQQAKAAHLQRQEKERAEQVYERVMKNALVKRLLGNQNGLGIQFGTLYPGSGFALGPDYTVRGLMNENLNLNVAAIGSVKQYYELRAGASFPHLASNRAVLDFEVRRLDAPQVHYYGPGNDSNKDNKTNYRLETGLVEMRAAAVPFRRVLRIGAAAGYFLMNVGPGQASDLPSAEKVFTPAQAPGIDHQTNYLRVGPFVEADWLDKPDDPHRGTSLGANYLWYVDRDARAFSFRRFQVYAEQYIPFWNEKRVIALRAKTNLTYSTGGDVVPFYMQSTLGGPNDLRGYSQFRFYDNNSLLFNAEYRRELGSPMDLAIFTDWGKVFPKPGDIGFSDMHGSAGVGLRFKTRASVVMRIDVGFSPEGVKFWWAFSDIFRGFHGNLY